MTDNKHLPDDVVRDMLDHIPIESLDYNEWLSIGMGLKNDKYPFEIWDEWSAKDKREGQYKGTEDTRKKWDSFDKEGYTLGTARDLAKKNDWTYPKNNSGYGYMDWEDEVSSDWEPDQATDRKTGNRSTTTNSKQEKEQNIVDHYLKIIEDANNKINLKDLDHALNVLYMDEDYIYFGGVKTSEGTFYKVANLKRDIAKNPELFETRLNTADGVYFCFNPFKDDSARRDDNISGYHYALIEWDHVPICKQIEIIIESRVPVKALIYSGGKSIHAIVPVNANNKEEYQNKVKKLFAKMNEYSEKCIDPMLYFQNEEYRSLCPSEVMKADPRHIDPANKNPSRLSRLPGAVRNGKQQKLLGVNLGDQSFDDWVRVLGKNDKGEEITPIKEYDAKSLNQYEAKQTVWIVDNILPLYGVTYVYGPPKSYKSFLILDMAFSIALGKDFLGFKTKKCGVLYIDTENDLDGFKNRSVLLEKEIPENFYCAPYVEGSPLHQLNNGFLVQLDNQLKLHPDIKVIIIDMFSAIKPTDHLTKTHDLYKQDNDVMTMLREFCFNHDVVAILIHHTKKGKEEDPLSMASGTLGAVGGASTAWAIKLKDRTSKETEMHVTGKKTIANTYCMKFNTDTMRFDMLGTLEEFEDNQQEEKRKEDYKKQKELFEKDPLTKKICTLVDQGNGRFVIDARGLIEIKPNGWTPEQAFINDTPAQVGKWLSNNIMNLYSHPDELAGEYESHDLESETIRTIFEDDLDGLKSAEKLIMVLPAGKSSHIEAGIAYGLGKECYAVGGCERQIRCT